MNKHRYNDVTQTLRAIAACPHIPEHTKHQVASRMLDDALDMVQMVREFDPRETWGTVALWADEDPLRVYAVVVALACMVDTERPLSSILAWTDTLAPRAA